ncbi:glycogen debranching N-terminal domain-containing protein [Cellulomonas sp. PhB143]|uniref:glycogen debranching N-terminal domain-containing protein n=1 Tax=Cellulomonas sp. PhB143 TaxID=2485186 RepID=UPI000F497D35|nr:glycogen debranching N-terminal domain-containing protein [Cellulomonas sp. PhB143]ROS75476.1 glycogen debranching enzyme [Cellulomonas sp. PhB143]
MTSDSILVRAGTMLLTDGSGDVRPSAGATHGLYLDDVRHVSTWHLAGGVPDGASSLVVAGATAGSSRRSTALVPPTTRNQPTDVLVVRNQEVSHEGLVERWRVTRTAPGPARVRLLLTVGADFVDQFAVRSDGRTYPVTCARTAVPRRDGVVLAATVSYGATSLEHTTVVSARPAPSHVRAGDESVLEWDLSLETGDSVTIDVTASVPGRAGEPPAAAGAPSGAAAAPGAASRALDDLDALVMPCPGVDGLAVPAAGAPWFMTLFGRDSIIASLLAHDERPQLLRDVVRALAATQASSDEPERLAQPGKIVHEVRVGDLARLGLVPYARYYGTVDATALFLVALGALDPESARTDGLQNAARSAVAWLRGPGGLDGGGFVTYRPDPEGLINQGWKDSHDAVVFRDGTLADGPIALCEVQGYAWRGLTDTARLARTVWGDAAWADELDRLAQELRTRFVERFWMDDVQFPALALDGDGRQVDALASNAGHLLWSGILDPRRARAVTDRLMAPEFRTGFGIRTLAAGQAPYAPTSYHNGSVWPHDTMLAAVGMHESGMTREARIVAGELHDAASAFDGRLPELFAGFGREEFPVPVRYAHAGVPQAWAAAAAVAAARLVAHPADEG